MALERVDGIDSGFARPKLGLAFAARHAETLLVLLVLGVALVIGLATAADYGLSTDEFNTDEYGPKALAWYKSAFADRSQFETVEEYLWMYGPWFQVLVAAVQSLELANPITVLARHELPARPRWARRCRADGTAHGRALGWVDGAHPVPADRLPVRQPVLRPYRRAVPVRHELVDPRDRPDGAAGGAELASDPCDRPWHRPRHRDAHRRGDHARLPRRRHEPVRARGAAAPWPRGLWPIAPDRLAYAARHPHRLADSDCALAVVADWKSAHAIPRGLSAL